MTKQSKTSHLPINHRQPSNEEIQTQKKREQDASVIGQMKAQQKLLKQKRKNNPKT